MSFLLFIALATAVTLEPVEMGPEEPLRMKQHYNTTRLYRINPSSLEKNSMYEVKIHTLGSVPTIYGVSFFAPREYNTNTTFFDESNLQFHTNNDGCVEHNGQVECKPFDCYVTLLYMGRTTKPSILNEEVTYFITMKRGALGLPGNVPTLIALAVVCGAISIVVAPLVVRYFDRLDHSSCVQKNN